MFAAVTAFGQKQDSNHKPPLFVAACKMTQAAFVCFYVSQELTVHWLQPKLPKCAWGVGRGSMAWKIHDPQLAREARRIAILVTRWAWTIAALIVVATCAGFFLYRYGDKLGDLEA
ncbi:MAG TPA: hypothetical protein VEH07_04465, partial [Alphaproteobacteria bacterium]|nr:hypothetical protein [Alphaproteobacteria bacterium]